MQFVVLLKSPRQYLCRRLDCVCRVDSMVALRESTRSCLSWISSSNFWIRSYLSFSQPSEIVFVSWIISTVLHISAMAYAKSAVSRVSSVVETGMVGMGMERVCVSIPLRRTCDEGSLLAVDQPSFVRTPWEGFWGKSGFSAILPLLWGYQQRISTMANNRATLIQIIRQRISKAIISNCGNLYRIEDLTIER